MEKIATSKQLYLYGINFQHARSMLAYYILKYPLNWASAGIAGSQFRTYQPVMLEPCYNFLNTLSVTHESRCIIRIHLHCEMFL